MTMIRTPLISMRNLKLIADVDAVIAPRCNLSQAWNKAYEKASGEIFFMQEMT